MENNSNTSEQKKNELRREIRSKTIGYIIGAFGLVAGLAWNDAVKAAIEYFYKVDGGIGVRFLYAAIITIIVVVVSYYATKWGMPKED